MEPQGAGRELVPGVERWSPGEASDSPHRAPEEEGAYLLPCPLKHLLTDKDSEPQGPKREVQDPIRETPPGGLQHPAGLQEEEP